MFAFSPFPSGYRFAVTFVDDTDYATRENIEPVYRLLAANRLHGTKTVWPLPPRRNSAFARPAERGPAEAETGSTLADPAYAEFVRKLRAEGFEIGLHGTAAGNSRREEIEAGLSVFHAVLGTMPLVNTFHSRNLDNLYCGRSKLDSPLLRASERLIDRSEYEGHRRGSDCFWGDIAHATFRYVRLPFHTIDEIDTLRVNPSMPFRDPRRPYVQRWFAASDGANVVRFVRLLSPAHVDRLARRRGACIVYTHFSKGFARRRAGRYELVPAFRQTVERLAGVDGGWFPTVTELLDRLEAIHGLGLSRRGRRVEVRNTNDRPVDDVALRVPPGTAVAIDGRPLPVRDGTVALPRIAGGARLDLASSRPGFQTIEPRGPVIGALERRRIEYLNYVGQIRSWARDAGIYP